MDGYYSGLALLFIVELVGIYLLVKGLWLRNRASRDHNQKKAPLDTEQHNT